MTRRILRLPAVLEKTGLSRSTWYRELKTADAPATVKITARCVGWYEDDVDLFMTRRKLKLQGSEFHILEADRQEHQDQPKKKPVLVINNDVATLASVLAEDRVS